MALKAGPKSSAVEPFDLSWRSGNLAKDRVELMRRVFGVELYPWQRRVLRDLGGFPRPRVAYVQVPRKNGKTMLAAALVLSEIILLDGRHTYGIADSERNLNSVLVRELRTLIVASPEAREALHVSRAGIENPGNGSFFEVRPALFSATQGINPHCVVADEVHLQRSEDVWAGMQMAGAARPDALLMGITTPGYDTAGLAHGLYRAVKEKDPTVYGRIFEADPAADIDDVKAWRVANPVWRNEGFMAALKFDRQRLPEHEFRRFRLGQWTATETAWLPYGAWKAAEAPTRPSPGPGEKVWLGFDGSFSGDSTALVGVTEDRHVFVVGCWENPGKSGWRVPRDDVEATLTAAFDRWDVMLHADPPYWHTEIAEWDARWPGRVFEFPTGSRARMAPACSAFYAAVMDGALTHDGDPRLAAHLSHAVVKPSPMGDYITKADKDSPLKIDLAVAAVIAFFEAARHQPPRRSPVFVL